MPDSHSVKNWKKKRTSKGSSGCWALPDARPALSTSHTQTHSTLLRAMGERLTDSPILQMGETEAQRGHSAGELQRKEWTLGLWALQQTTSLTLGSGLFL